jgi:hypothetical protein
MPGELHRQQHLTSLQNNRRHVPHVQQLLLVTHRVHTSLQRPLDVMLL